MTLKKGPEKLWGPELQAQLMARGLFVQRVRQRDFGRRSRAQSPIDQSAVAFDTELGHAILDTLARRLRVVQVQLRSQGRLTARPVRNEKVASGAPGASGPEREPTTFNDRV